jgi:hypothetical protein
MCIMAGSRREFWFEALADALAVKGGRAPLRLASSAMR